MTSCLSLPTDLDFKTRHSPRVKDLVRTFIKYQSLKYQVTRNEINGNATSELDLRQLDHYEEDYKKSVRKLQDDKYEPDPEVRLYVKELDEKALEWFAAFKTAWESQSNQQRRRRQPGGAGYVDAAKKKEIVEDVLEKLLAVTKRWGQKQHNHIRDLHDKGILVLDLDMPKAQGKKKFKKKVKELREANRLPLHISKFDDEKFFSHYKTQMKSYIDEAESAKTKLTASAMKKPTKSELAAMKKPATMELTAMKKPATTELTVSAMKKQTKAELESVIGISLAKTPRVGRVIPPNDCRDDVSATNVESTEIRTSSPPIPPPNGEVAGAVVLSPTLSLSRTPRVGVGRAIPPIAIPPNDCRNDVSNGEVAVPSSGSKKSADPPIPPPEKSSKLTFSTKVPCTPPARTAILPPTVEPTNTNQSKVTFSTEVKVLSTPAPAARTTYLPIEPTTAEELDDLIAQAQLSALESDLFLQEDQEDFTQQADEAAEREAEAWAKKCSLAQKRISNAERSRQSLRKIQDGMMSDKTPMKFKPKYAELLISHNQKTRSTRKGLRPVEESETPGPVRQLSYD